MPRIDLRVPFPDKDTARRLGARWDACLKTWYVPDGVDAEPLRAWFPEPLSHGIRAPRYVLATTLHVCWRCQTPTPVHAIVLPAEHEIWYVADDPGDDHWETPGTPALLSYILDIAEQVVTRLRALAPRYRIDCSHERNAFYWMNHCERCDAKLGDHNNHHEPGGAFWPTTPAAEIAIDSQEISESFAAACSYSYGQAFCERE